MVAPPSPGSRLQHMDYDAKILPRTGGYGRYNRLVVVCSWFPTFAVTLNLISDVFYTRIPDSYHCQPDPRLLPSALLLSNVTSQRYLNLTIPWVNGTGLSHCQLFKYPSNVSDFTGNVPKEKVSCTKGWVFAHEAGLQSNFVTEWNLVCNDYWKIPLQHICFMSGWIMGYILLGTLSDWLGRRHCFLMSTSLSCLLGVAVCLSNSAVIFLLLRLLQGSTLAGVFVSSYITRLELCDPLHRLMASMVGGFFSIFAEVCLPGVAALCRDWPVLQAVATLPLLQLLSCWCCASMFPESPRWLLATNQMSLAKRSLQDVTVRNGVCLQDDMYPGETLLAQIDSAPEERQPKFFTVLELRRTRVIWKNCLILSFTLFIGTGIQYCFTRNLHTYSTNFYFAYFVRVITGALACVFICLSVNRYGRRGMLLLSAIVTGLSSLLLLALTQYLYGAMVLVLSVVGLLFSQALAMLSVFFASEVMPTVLRGGCLGLVLAAGCVGMAASSLMELQNNSGYFLHQVIFASFAVLSVLCILLLPESKRKSLPDSVAEGENQRRPPLFSARPHRDSLPLLYTTTPLSEYNPDNYSRLVSATKKMLSKETLPYRIAVPAQPPLLPGTDAQEHEREEMA
ncbi:putative solute carrier family 22 member 31 [Takifugu rubripes]|uniref:putative solute carrier family 22 member 31 n=1 Tax=Takifugu rubripes TaxID=31033 RepID=UPI0005D1EEAD|nr:putative solute carrier family 22 member 31 [Takifugu rubripes]|eukprot:XP_011608437.1 PREDICTED: putative solute carrier family 22 member 31 [Takifugu rubripes]